jgi:putative transposase
MLCSGDTPKLLKSAIESVRARHSFKIDAIVLLPDHLHCLWTLPPGDADFSTRWMLIKNKFAKLYKAEMSDTNAVSDLPLWQNRFWEHQIRDDRDFARHVEYIHYNPVKHGLARAPREWQYSSFMRYVKAGKYHEEWGAPDEVVFGPEIGNE